MKNKILHLTILILALSACGGRIPSEAKTARLSQKYFQSYGKKYEQSELGQNPVQSTQVQGVQELQKNLATALVDLTLQDGSRFPVLATLIRKFPLGWRLSTWEKRSPLVSSQAFEATSP